MEYSLHKGHLINEYSNVGDNNICKVCINQAKCKTNGNRPCPFWKTLNHSARDYRAPTLACIHIQTP